MSFEIGKMYNRQKELHDKFGGNRQSGISTCANYPIIFLFKSPSGKIHGYQDGWVSKDIYHYTGEGQFGNMELVRGNLAIKEHKARDKQLHLFEKEKSGSGMYRYLGQFEYIRHKNIPTVDSDQVKREAIVFELRKLP